MRKKNKNKMSSPYIHVWLSLHSWIILQYSNSLAGPVLNWSRTGYPIHRWWRSGAKHNAYSVCCMVATCQIHVTANCSRWHYKVDHPHLSQRHPAFQTQNHPLKNKELIHRISAAVNMEKKKHLSSIANDVLNRCAQ